MAKKKLWVGILVTVLVFGMTVVGCDNGSTSGNSGNGGIFTLNNIPSEYNGKYAMILANRTYDGDDGPVLVGAQSVNMATYTFTGSRISNGSVNIPMWVISFNGSTSRFTGNRTIDVGVSIFNSATSTSYDDEIAEIWFVPVIFSNGNATKSFNDAGNPRE